MLKKQLNIIQGDCNKILPTLKEDSIDLVVTSPPYNVGLDYNFYDDKLPYDEYLSFLYDVWKNCYRVLKWDGRICINMSPVRRLQRFIISDVAKQLEDIGYRFRDHIIWNKQNITKRSAWGSWMSPSCPWLLQPYEFIIIYNKRFPKKRGSKSDITRDEFIEYTNSLWSFSGETKVPEHPAVFPEELPKRLIKLYSYVDDTVLDPFLGSGTTLKVAKDLDRRGIGIELDPKYVELAKERCKVE